MSTPAVIDPASIASLRELNPGDDDEFLREIVGIFLEDTPRRIVELDESLAAGDVPKFTRAAHSIKGSSGNVGAMALREVAGALEHQSKNQGLALVGAPLVQLKAEFTRAHDELARIIAR
jgi:HPt (histidine-containing phosphotransfer) domain-containing protein